MGGYDGVEMLVELVLAYDFVRHSYSERLHGVGEGVVIGADHLIEVVNHVLFEVHHDIIIPLNPPLQSINPPSEAYMLQISQIIRSQQLRGRLLQTGTLAVCSANPRKCQVR